MDNRFRPGKANFVAEGRAASVLLAGRSGMRFEEAILDHAIGSEVVLILTDTTPFAYKLKQHKPFQLILTSGAAQTGFGPVLFLLWWMPPLTDGKPFALYEHILNASHAGTMAGLRKAAEQTHLHVLLVGPNQQLLDLYEFENIFELGNLVEICEWAGREYAGMNFAAAKAEYEETNDPMDLLQEALAQK